jgi:hypothetical protein
MIGLLAGMPAISRWLDRSRGGPNQKGAGWPCKINIDTTMYAS